MSNPSDHLRVGQAWTAYVAPAIVTLFIALLGVAALASGLFVSSAADSSDPAAAMAEVIPMPAAAPPRKPAHRGVHATSVASAVPATLSSDDRQRVKAGSSQVALGGVALLVLAALFMAYRVLSIRNCVLFTDDGGVWLRKGVLPWTRRTYGVKWRDLEGASVFTGFKSWLLRSHTVRVSHRFTKDSEIVVNHVPRGGDVAGRINDIHRRLLLDPAGHLGVDAPR